MKRSGSSFAGRASRLPVGRACRASFAFTLIELLVVIAIIAIIAAMVAGMSVGAARLKKEKVINAQKARLVTIIDSYHARMGFYPPDNGNLLLLPPGIGWGSPQYEQFTATNQLLYELTGAVVSNVNNAQFFATFDGTSNIPAAAFTMTYARGGIANSDPSQAQSFFNPPPNFNDYTNYPGQNASQTNILKGLIVPVDTVSSFTPFQTVRLNFWHYDSSTTNRHNPNSYDLWAEYFVGRQLHTGAPIMVTNGNW